MKKGRVSIEKKSKGEEDGEKRGMKKKAVQMARK